MKEFIVYVPEKHVSHRVIQAETQEEAIQKVKNGQGEEIFCEYSDTLDEGWSAEETVGESL